MWTEGLSNIVFETLQYSICYSVNMAKEWRALKPLIMRAFWIPMLRKEVLIMKCFHVIMKQEFSPILLFTWICRLDLSLVFVTWICHLDLSKLKLIGSCDGCHAWGRWRLLNQEHLVMLLAGPISHTSTQYIDFVDFLHFNASVYQLFCSF